ncbi:hypothetical protein DFH07DRAFT_418293 [Mycena maculata]|uniref:Uncharacterized protein n=1 Tax=Mycena maculata TaxID=230809 RepID=A0AAD7JGH9_9AGAR|nr:hypothetical protein DFH07DRAFT_418293 [Mycena maculata]
MEVLQVQPTNTQTSMAVPSPHLFQNAADFDVAGGQFVSAESVYISNVDVNPPTVSPGLNRRAITLRPRVTDSDSTSEHNLSNLVDVRTDLGESEIYCSQLLRRRRGFPLYEPGPQRNLPVEYRRNGVSIGDVGRVTPEGVFDFFFNIYLDAHHPINANDVPEGFCPLPHYLSKDVVHIDYDAGSYVSSSSIQQAYTAI